MDERERLQELHLTLEGALEQLSRAHQLALPDAPELPAIERQVAELVTTRNAVRERLMKVLAKPTLNRLK